MGWQHTHIPAVTTSLPVRKFGEFGKTSIPILNPAEPTSERQQVNGPVEGQRITQLKKMFSRYFYTQEQLMGLFGYQEKKIHKKASMGMGRQYSWRIILFIIYSGAE